MRELTRAFAETGFEALQETVKEQFAPGQTGGRSRRTITLMPRTLRLSWIAAVQQMATFTVD